jgi:hypothetical protein
MAVKPSKPKTSKKQKPEKKSSKRKSVISKANNNNVRTTQQGLVNQAAKTGNQTTVVRINNALAKASAENIGWGFSAQQETRTQSSLFNDRTDPLRDKSRSSRST